MVMAWLPLPTVNDWLSWEAAFQSASPAWLASIVQVPASSSVTDEPSTEQTSGVAEVNVTARPDVALALISTGVSGRRTSSIVGKLIDWLPRPIVNDWLACGAGL